MTDKINDHFKERLPDGTMLSLGYSGEPNEQMNLMMPMKRPDGRPIFLDDFPEFVKQQNRKE